MLLSFGIVRGSSVALHCVLACWHRLSGAVGGSEHSHGSRQLHCCHRVVEPGGQQRLAIRVDGLQPELWSLLPGRSGYLTSSLSVSVCLSLSLSVSLCLSVKKNPPPPPCLLVSVSRLRFSVSVPLFSFLSVYPSVHGAICSPSLCKCSFTWLGDTTRQPPTRQRQSIFRWHPDSKRDVLFSLCRQQIFDQTARIGCAVARCNVTTQNAAYTDYYVCNYATGYVWETRSSFTQDSYINEYSPELKFVQNSTM